MLLVESSEWPEVPEGVLPQVITPSLTELTDHIVISPQMLYGDPRRQWRSDV